MERWVEHYSDLNSRENIVSPAALDVIDCLPTMGELDSDPSLEELSKAIDSLASGKAPCNCGIPPNLTKHCKTTLLLPVHEVLCQYWQDGVVLQDTRDSKFITLYKDKGERNDCTEAHPYSALSAKYLLGSYWYASRRWRSVSTRSHNVASELNGQH